jgi:hypothetical protein
MDVKLLTFNMGILTAATIVLLVEYIAQTTAPPPTITSHASTNATLDTILGTPFFEDRGSKVTGTRVISNNPIQTEDSFVASNNPIQTEDSFVANVTIRGIGNATDTGTFVTTHKPSGITTSEGQGIISAADGEIATYTAKDLGFTTEKGDTTYRGIQIFNTNTTGKMAFMDNLVGLYVYQNNADGDRITGKIWEWK